VREADILLHIVDISHAGFEEQIETVNNTLQEINAGDKPNMYIFNKIDAFSFIEKDDDDLSPRSKENRSLEEWKNSWMAKHNSPSLFISAKFKENLEDFKAELYEKVKSIHSQRFPYNDYLYNSDWEVGEQ
jgi:GTP-binding protein HflX